MRFALISDEHFGPTAYFAGKLRKLTARSGELSRAFVARMNDEVHPDLVINLGDVIEDESRPKDREHYAQFTEILSGLSCPVLHVAGNHDQVNLSDDDLRKLWQHEGELFYSRDVCGVHFSVLRTIEISDHAIHLPAEQIAWLRADLAASELPSVVLMHHPASEMRLDGNRWFQDRPYVCRVAERRDFQRVVSAAPNVVAVFNGHVHWNHFDLVGGVPYITLQSLIENLDDDAPGRAAAAHAVVELDERRLVVRVAGAEPVRYQVELRARD
ncbi:MAG TPA: metallophosphoesterase [Polyangiaceae bacterium]|jgi:3',5'-cyclic AMP phosphodiesterase CpdA